MWTNYNNFILFLGIERKFQHGISLEKKFDIEVATEQLFE